MLALTLLRLHFAALDHQAVDLDDDYGASLSQVITAVAALPNHNVLGLAFDPGTAPGVLRLYVSHSQLEANGGAGTCPTDASPYSGQVSILEGPDFDTVEPLITGLPVSNFDHGINGRSLSA